MVRAITNEIADMAGAPKATGFGKGGMVTKLAAGRIAVAAGCAMAIINGKEMHPLQRFETTGRGTWFLPDATPGHRPQAMDRRHAACRPERSSSMAAPPERSARGKSLLPAGVIEVEGKFERGDAVRVRDASGREIARGLSAYSSADASRSSATKAVISRRFSATVAAKNSFTGMISCCSPPPVTRAPVSPP